MKNANLILARTLSVMALSFAGAASADKSNQYSELLQNGAVKTSQAKESVQNKTTNSLSFDPASQNVVGKSQTISKQMAASNTKQNAIKNTDVDTTDAKNAAIKSKKLILE